MSTNVTQSGRVATVTVTVNRGPQGPTGATGPAGSDAEVTTENVRSAGALMDDELANPAQVKAFDSADFDAAGTAETVHNATVGTAAQAAIDAEEAARIAADALKFSAFYPSEYSTPGELDFLENLRLSYLSPTLPALTCYTAADAAGCGPIHTSVMHFPTPFGGFRWWMAYTPFDGSDTEIYENPSIAVSHDGITWQDHPTITNPIHPAPGNAPSSWNSDTNLSFIDGKLYIFWRRQTGSGDYIEWRETEDGVTLETTTVSSLITTYGVASPSIIQEEDGTLTMFAVDFNTAAPFIMHRWTTPDLNTAWTRQGACTLNNATLSGVWHGTVRKINGKYFLIYSGGNTEDAAFFAESTDGDTFTVADFPILTTPFASESAQHKNYKPDFVPIFKDGRLALRLYTCTRSFFNWGTAEWGRESSTDIFRRIMPLAVDLFEDYLIADNFKRADGAVGNATSGQTWTVVSGGISIDGNRARGTSHGNNRITIDAGVADVRVGMRIADYTEGDSEEFYIMGRYSGGDYIRFGRSGTKRLVCQSINGGTVTLGQIESHYVRSGDWLEMELEGDQIRFYVNGAHMGTVTSSLNETATAFGIQCAEDATWCDAFYVRTL